MDLALDDSIRDLLTVKMARAQKPSKFYELERFKARAGSAAALAAKAQALKEASKKK